MMEVVTQGVLSDVFGGVVPPPPDPPAANTAKSLPRPISVEIKGQQVGLYTVGYVARILNRTTWTIGYWQRLGLFPEAPFLMRGRDPRGSRGYYPEPFLRRLSQIAAQPYVGRRMVRESWIQFCDEVFAAYDETVSPLTGGVICRGAHGTPRLTLTEIRGRS